MQHSLQLLFIVALSYCGLSSSVLRATYCVLPFPSNKDCNKTCQECASLAVYSTLNISDDSSFLFYPGVHYLNQTWMIQNVHNVSFDAKGSVTIKCSTSTANAGLYFLNVTGISIDGIEILHCGLSKHINHHEYNTAIIIQNGKDVMMNALKVSDSFSGGMTLLNVVGDININGSTFLNNTLVNTTQGNFIVYNDCRGTSTLNIANTLFQNNSYSFSCTNKDYPAAGLTLIIKCNGLVMNFSNLTFTRNRGCHGGNLALICFGAYQLKNTNITIDNSLIEHGEGVIGGGIYILLANSKPYFGYGSGLIIIIKNSVFKNNGANYVGGAIYIKSFEVLKYSDGSRAVNVTIEGCHFEGNYLSGYGNSGGLALHLSAFITRRYEQHHEPQLKLTLSSSNFTKHTNNLTSSVILVRACHFFKISSINITYNNCTGLMAITSNILVSGNVHISRNHAYSGGGISLSSGSTIYFQKYTTLYIIRNSAKHTGGGIYIETDSVAERPPCFFQLDSEAYENESLRDIRAVVRNNTADFAGDNIYGGSIENCYLIQSPHYDNTFLFKKIFSIYHNSYSPKYNSSITSFPKKVCPFNRTTRRIQNCTGQRNYAISQVQVHPGQAFRIEAAIVGQMNGIVPGTVYATLFPTLYTLHLHRGESVQKIPSKEKKMLSYTVYSVKENINATMYLTVVEARFNKLIIPIHIKSCPLGYSLKSEKGSTEHYCNCDKFKQLSHYPTRIKCYKKKRVGILYHPPMWIGVIRNGDKQHLAISNLCPRDYCYSSKVFLNLKNITEKDYINDIQCYYNRTGILCGSCKNGASLLLGTPGCRKDCTNLSLLLLIVFAFAGAFLIFIITLLNLTVSMGTVNGLIFYANILQIFTFILFDDDHILSYVLKVFIAWLNLDFGITTCFFEGMDGFSKALLQFVFPVYIWMIAGTIIILSRRYTTAMNLLGQNSIKILATVILLSYSKTIHAVMDALHFTVLKSTDTLENPTRWTINGSLVYLGSKHIVIFLIGVLFGILSLPFMIIFLCICHLPRFSNWPFFSWINTLNPFFDCYTGPFTNRGRFWTGLLLLARIFILAIYSCNNTGSDIITMSSTVMVCIFLMFVALTLPRGLYKKYHLNIIEYFFLINLGLLFSGLICTTYYDAPTAQKWLIRTFIGLSFIAFTLIIVYHIGIKFCCHMQRIRFFRNNRMMHYPGTSEEYEPLISHTD